MLAGGQVAGHAAFHARHQQVLEPHVGERAPHHDIVVAPACPVLVEVLLLHSVVQQIRPRRTVLLDAPGRADVVGGDTVAQHGQCPCPGDLAHHGRCQLHALEVWRVGDVGTGGIPSEEVAFGHRQLLPVFVSREHFRVDRLVALAGDAFLHHIVHFADRRPDFLQVHRFAFGVVAHGILVPVDVHRTGEGIGHHQRRAGQVVRPHIGMHAPLEVAVAAENRTDHEGLLVDLGADALRQRATVADARGTPVTHHVKAEFFQFGQQSGLREVVRHHFATGGQARLYPRFRGQALRCGFLCQHTGGHHHVRVACIGATGDGSNHHAAIGQLAVAGGIASGHIARHIQRLLLRGLCGFLQLRQVGVEVGLHVGQGNAVLRSARPGQAGHHGGEVEFQRVGVIGHRGCRIVEHPLGLGIGFHEGNLL